jgi:hypothetical protein
MPQRPSRTHMLQKHQNNVADKAPPTGLPHQGACRREGGHSPSTTASHLRRQANVCARTIGRQEMANTTDSRGRTGTTRRPLVNTNSKVAPLSIWSLLSVEDDERTIQALAVKTLARESMKQRTLDTFHETAQLDRDGECHARNGAAGERLLKHQTWLH